MKKSTKAIVSGLAGLVLFAGGMGVSASFPGLWAGNQDVEQTAENLFALDGKINTLKGEKVALLNTQDKLNADIATLKSTQTSITNALKSLVDEFAPQYSNHITPENLAAIAALIQQNAGKASIIVENELIVMEQHLNITAPANNIADRLIAVYGKLDTLMETIANQNLKLHEVSGKITQLEEDLDAAGDSNNALEIQLQHAKNDAQRLREISDEIMGRHENVEPTHGEIPEGETTVKVPTTEVAE